MSKTRKHIERLIAGAALAASVTGAMAQSHAPEPMRLVVQSQPGASAGGQTSSAYSMTVNDNGKVIKLEMKDGVVTTAEIDGKVVPDDRIENDGDVIRLKDEAGEVVYEHELPSDISWNGRGFAAFDLNNPGWRALNRLGSGNQFLWNNNGLSGFGVASGGASALGGEPDDDGTVAIAESYKAPPVMMGVQLGAADSTLCGHLGLERENVTLLTGVHEGLPAANAGLKPYDLIVAVNGSNEAGPAAIRKALEDKKAGDTINLGVVHSGVRKEVTVTLDAYDRKRLSMAKAERIDDAEDRFVVATAPRAPFPPMPPLPPEIPEEYRKKVEEYMKSYVKEHGARAPQAITISPFGTRSRSGSSGSGSGRSDEHTKLLRELERQQETAAAQADEFAKRAEELANRARSRLRSSESADEMRERMQRMEEMLKKLMDEKLQDQKSQEPKVKESGNRT